MNFIKNKLAVFWIIVIVLHISALSFLRFFPYPEFFIYSYLTKIGMVPYKEIMDQHFPGLVFLPINFATLGIDTVSEMRFVSYLLVVLSHTAIFKISEILFEKNWIRIMPNLLFALWHPFMEGYVLWIDSFAQTTLLFAAYFLIKNAKNNTFFAGIILGLTLILKQTALPIILLIFFYLLFWNKDKIKIRQLTAGIAIPLVFFTVWVLLKGILIDFYYWTFIFNVTTFAEMGRKIPRLPELIKVLPVLGAPFVWVLALKNKQYISKVAVILLIFFVGSISFALARFDYVHLQPALPFAILLLTYFATCFKSPRIEIKRILVVFVVLSAAWNLYLIRPYFGKNTYFFGEFEEKLVAKVDMYRQGGGVFALGTTPHIYYLTGTTPPGKVFVFQFPWFMRIAEGKIYKGLTQEPPAVVVRDKEASVGGMNLLDYMPKISAYVQKYYSVVDVVDGVEIMKRN